MSKNSNINNFRLLATLAFYFMSSVYSMEIELIDSDNKKTNRDSLRHFCSKLADLNPDVQIPIKDITHTYTKKKEINLFYRNIQFIPMEISLLQNLKILSFSNNHLTSLPKEIGSLKNLQTLNLSNNQISLLPKEIGGLEGLKKLDLYDNQLTSIPKEIGLLKKLQILYVCKNRLASLPKEIGSLKELQVLSLYNNQLASFPTEIQSLHNLEELSLFDNPHLGIKFSRNFSGIDLRIFHQLCDERRIIIQKYMIITTPINDDKSLLSYIPKDVINVIFGILWEKQKNS